MPDKMFEIRIPSWENDADNPQIHFLTGGVDDIHFYLHLAKMFVSKNDSNPGIGNGFSHMDVIQNAMDTAISNCRPTSPVASAISNSSSYEWLCENLIGWPVDEYYQENAPEALVFCRAVDLDSIRIFELNPEKKNLLEDFLEASGHYWS